MSNLPAPSVRNITRVFREATAEQVAVSSLWYHEAHTIATGFAAKYGVTVEIAAGVIAATSPINSWVANVRLAERFLAAKGLTSGYLKSGLAKAQAILDGADPVATLHGNKTVAFYSAIVNAGKTDAVTVDRHAYSVAVGHRVIDVPSMSNKRYEEFAECYRKAAKIISKELGYKITASEIQSTTWQVWRKRYWSETAFEVAA